ncbi:hypothetical protein ACPXCE_08940 [Streptomyces sp. DT24]|uniref:hypothetical protein n=1 Tax=Streptomyces sp. DT24 TaxID=3416520 RepID=UPI003CEFCA9B
MRSITLTFCVVVVAAATLTPISSALAGSEPRAQLSVTPSTTAPGGEVEFWTDACRGPHAKEAIGRSAAFVSEAHFAPTRTGLHAEARIRSDAAPRDYDIWVTCKDGAGHATGRLTVVHHSRPVAPVRAGGGGTAPLADQAPGQEGPGITHEAIGLGLAAVAAGAVAFRVRRRRPAAD